MSFINLTRVMPDGADHEFQLDSQRIVGLTKEDFGGQDVTAITVEGLGDDVLVRETATEVLALMASAAKGTP